MHKDSGQVFLDCLTDGLGLTLQESWLQQLTVRENILFGREYDQEKYDRVIKACALVQDLKVGRNLEILLDILLYTKYIHMCAVL